jgi:hypothetical protein
MVQFEKMKKTRFIRALVHSSHRKKEKRSIIFYVPQIFAEIDLCLGLVRQINPYKTCSLIYYYSLWKLIKLLARVIQ